MTKNRFEAILEMFCPLSGLVGQSVIGIISDNSRKSDFLKVFWDRSYFPIIDLLIKLNIKILKSIQKS